MPTTSRQQTGSEVKTERVQQKPRGNGVAPLDAEVLKRLYASMLKCRMVEERARLLFRQGGGTGSHRSRDDD